MIPLPGLAILLWVVRVCFGVFVLSIGASFAAVRIAHASWRAQQPATSSERLALIVLVPGLLCFHRSAPSLESRPVRRFAVAGAHQPRHAALPSPRQSAARPFFRCALAASPPSLSHR
jgi:hypothetical protein